MELCRNGLTILNFGELASPPYPSGGGSGGGGGSGSAGSGTTGSAGGGSDTEGDQESVGVCSSVKRVSLISGLFSEESWILSKL